MKIASVITTINPPTHATKKLYGIMNDLGGKLIVVGDKKGPTSFKLDKGHFYDLEEQLKLPFQLSRKLPTGHYSRKNLGYLLAISSGAECIYETDDDNIPTHEWTLRSLSVQATKRSGPGWINVYMCFSDEHIWPRGFPLNHIRDTSTVGIPKAGKLESVDAPIQQGLADGSPDVDALWRLIFDKPIEFKKNPSVLLRPGSWCPFNSQSTWWWPVAFPLMYLPSFCSFRMTDIWRSFFAQRCLWELDLGVVFHAPEVFQERNFHRLIADFEDELDGYLQNETLVNILSNLTLKKGPGGISENLMKCYKALVDANILPTEELQLVAAWITDLNGAKTAFQDMRKF